MLSLIVQGESLLVSSSLQEWASNRLYWIYIDVLDIYSSILTDSTLQASLISSQALIHSMAAGTTSTGSCYRRGIVALSRNRLVFLSLLSVVISTVH